MAYRGVMMQGVRSDSVQLFLKCIPSPPKVGTIAVDPSDRIITTEGTEAKIVAPERFSCSLLDLLYIGPASPKSVKIYPHILLCHIEVLKRHISTSKQTSWMGKGNIGGRIEQLGKLSPQDIREEDRWLCGGFWDFLSIQSSTPRNNSNQRQIPVIYFPPIIQKNRLKNRHN